MREAGPDDQAAGGRTVHLGGEVELAAATALSWSFGAARFSFRERRGARDFGVRHAALRVVGLAIGRIIWRREKRRHLTVRVDQIGGGAADARRARIASSALSSSFVERTELRISRSRSGAIRGLKIAPSESPFLALGASAALFPVGSDLAQTYQSDAVAIATSLFWLLGALVFFVVVAGCYFHGRRQLRLSGRV